MHIEWEIRAQPRCHVFQFWYSHRHTQYPRQHVYVAPIYGIHVGWNIGPIWDTHVGSTQGMKMGFEWVPYGIYLGFNMGPMSFSDILHVSHVDPIYIYFPCGSHILPIWILHECQMFPRWLLCKSFFNPRFLGCILPMFSIFLWCIPYHFLQTVQVCINSCQFHFMAFIWDPILLLLFMGTN